jgi:hypothetical protein
LKDVQLLEEEPTATSAEPTAEPAAETAVETAAETKSETAATPAILITGAHHARELITI